MIEGSLKSDKVMRAYGKTVVGAVVIAFVLSVQFLAGIWMNLYDNIPKNHPGYNDNNYLGASYDIVKWGLSSGITALQLHIVLAGILAVSVVYLQIVVGPTNSKVLIVSALVAISFFFLASLYGLTYLDNYQRSASLLMAVGFLGFTLTDVFVLAYALRLRGVPREAV